MLISNYIITALILFGAVIMFMSTRYVKKIFDILPNNKLKANWKKLRLLMFLFLAGYLAAAVVVILGKTELLTVLSGAIFLMGSLFVFLVVVTGLASFRRLKELNQNLDDTELKNKELEQFAYITSHDLKTPLRGISSLTSFIKADLETGHTDEVEHHLATMQGRVKRLESLIDGILHYSKIGKIRLESVDLNALVQAEFNNHRESDNLRLTIEGKLPTVRGDKTQLSQVVSNLIGNAIKHNDKEVCEVSVSSTGKADYHEITFEDNGPGIAPNYHRKIFEVFQTLADQETNESTGIGLSIVQKIIKKHEGSIRVESDGKLGTRFIVSYPKALLL